MTPATSSPTRTGTTGRFPAARSGPSKPARTTIVRDANIPDRVADRSLRRQPGSPGLPSGLSGQMGLGKPLERPALCPSSQRNRYRPSRRLCEASTQGAGTALSDRPHSEEELSPRCHRCVTHWRNRKDIGGSARTRRRAKLGTGGHGGTRREHWRTRGVAGSGPYFSSLRKSDVGARNFDRCLTAVTV